MRVPFARSRNAPNVGEWIAVILVDDRIYRFGNVPLVEMSEIQIN